MNKIDRRKFLKIGGAGAASIAVGGLDLPGLPWLSTETALAKGSKEAWCFGVMADSQWNMKDGDWSGSTAEEEASTSALTIIDSLNQEFIAHNCKFVVQVGDLVNDEERHETRTLPFREAHCQDLYDAGIGFFPVRGNHEASATAAVEMTSLFPQTQGEGENVNGARNFNSPQGLSLEGLSYSFDYKNVRCVFIDQFVRPDATDSNYNDNALDQVDWVDGRLTSRPHGQHAFVFAHKNLIGGNHKDSLFGSEITSNAEKRDAFISSLYENNVAYFMSGHDHMHHHSIISTADGSANVEQVICSSNSYKFYTPRSGDDGREQIIAEELYTIGYYIVTVDGDRVTVDFYSTDKGSTYNKDGIKEAPKNSEFYLRERFGCSLNGEKYAVQQGDSYSSIEGRYKGTLAQVLYGVDGNNEQDLLGRPYAKTVNTGWADGQHIAGAVSNVFTLWGMVDNLSLWEDTDASSDVLPYEDESQATDVYTLAMTCASRGKAGRRLLESGKIVIAARTDSGDWVNAVELNIGESSEEFVQGPFQTHYPLGTYGVDPRTGVVWAVLDHEGEFVLMTKPEKKYQKKTQRRHGHY